MKKLKILLFDMILYLSSSIIPKNYNYDSINNPPNCVSPLNLNHKS